jgi:DNA-binding GntR family transcriptional regulator
MAETNSRLQSFQLQRKSLPDEIAQSLRERILNGEFKGGEPLAQAAIAAEYGCSRMPVREAFRQLESAGLIELKVHRGAVVTSLPTEQIMELFELRALLECDSLAHSIPRMTANDFAAAQAILVELGKAYGQRDIQMWGALNWQFHCSLYKPARRPQSLVAISNINVQTDRYIRLHLLLTDTFAKAEEEHRQLLGLCIDGDVEQAVPFLRMHICDAGRSLVGAIKADPKRS